MTRELIDQIVKLADNTARAIAFAPIEMITAPLDRFRAELESGFSEEFGADVAAQIGKMFMDAVLKYKRVIETAGSETIH